MFKKFLHDKLGIWGHSTTEKNLWRGWLYFGKRTLGLELALFSPSCAIGIELFEEDDFTTSFCLPYLISIYFSGQNIFPQKLKDYFHKKYRYESREIALSIHHNNIWWEFWADPNSWDNKTSKWIKGNFDFVDFLLGKHSFIKETLIENETVKIRMPEKTYEGIGNFERRTWKRPRWFKPIIREEWSFDFDKDPIPTPDRDKDWSDGKDDAWYGFGSSKSNLTEACRDIEKRFVQERLQRGGVTWLPEGYRIVKNDELILPPGTAIYAGATGNLTLDNSGELRGFLEGKNIVRLKDGR